MPIVALATPGYGVPEITHSVMTLGIPKGSVGSNSQPTRQMFQQLGSPQHSGFAVGAAAEKFTQRVLDPHTHSSFLATMSLALCLR